MIMMMIGIKMMNFNMSDNDDNQDDDFVDDNDMIM